MTRAMSTLPIQVGQQSFDGLTRLLSSTVGGRPHQYGYTANQLPVSSLTLADGKSITYDYVHELDEQIKQCKPEGEPAVDSTYDAELGLLHTRENALGRQSRTYNANGHLQSETWRVGSTDYTTDWHYSLKGVLLGFDDPNQVVHTRYLDAFGRLRQIEAGNTTCLIEYDDLSRPFRYTTTDQTATRTLVESLTYDSFGREHTRTLSSTVGGATQNRIQTLTYTDTDQVKTREWKEAGKTHEETYSYDALGRLVHYTASPGLAQDAFGNCVVEQAYALNVLDGYVNVATSFEDGSSDTATYCYDNADDPCQVSAIEHTHASWPARITLRYDLRGRLVSDSLGRTVTWDGHDRVTRVDYQRQSCAYDYDPNGNLCDRTIDKQLARSFHSDGHATHEQRGESTLQFMGEASRLFAIDCLAKGVHRGTLLLGCDAQGSVRVEIDEQVGSRHYVPHGGEPLRAVSGYNPFGFAGERREPLTGWYIPGGYRPYDPLLMIFLAPDSESPFGDGGLNTYAYCCGDPVNRIDPSGHSTQAWLKIGFGILGAAVATAISFGALLPIVAGGVAALSVSSVLTLTSAALSVTAGVTGSVSAILELDDPDSKAAAILGDISLYTGVAATLTGGLAKAAVSRGAQSVFNRPLFARASPASPSLFRTSSFVTGGRTSPPSSPRSDISAASSRSDRAAALNRTHSTVQPTPNGIEMQPTGVADSSVAVTEIGPKTSVVSRSPGSAADNPLYVRRGATDQLAQSPYLSQIPLPPGSPLSQGRRSLGQFAERAAVRRLFAYRETAV